MESRLFVGNVPYVATEAQLETLFGEHGVQVVAVSIPHDDQGRGRGFAFVTCRNEEDAARAIKQMAGVEFGGRTLRMDRATPKKAAGDRERSRR